MFNMSSLPYTLAGASLLSTFVVTILNCICFATSQASADVATIFLSAVGCLALIALGLLHHKNVQTGRLSCTYLTGGYLLIAAAASAGAMAMSHRGALFITRSVFWALSVFAQGLYCGFITMNLYKEQSNPDWPRSYPHELKDMPESPKLLPSPPRVADLSELFEPKRSSLRKYPRRSSRYSDATLCPSSKTQNASIDTTSTHSSPSPSPITDKAPNLSNRPLLRGNNSIRSMPSLRRNAPTPLSLDNLVHPPLPSPTSTLLDSPTTSNPNSTWEYNPFRETNIHPLFRSNSPCPSPTLIPGTMVKASPSAGQTIPAGTITRMRSARSLRDSMRAPSPLPSPLPESEERRRMSMLENRYDLNESPYEK
ncbi:uncharacterized protein N7529_004597 [Penicillium soppii]|uniref:uncharacterized protein n=1 Tax=Penicillium soppii TaxID=69789 RepID=UPI00254799E2|nr:uncharacterized protein N7529_004597 [Penicillium soppii]KAJ5872244.1 hypothetical protein N7529_004597 [Penicillium soppii]